MVRPNRRSSTPYYEIAVPMQTNFAAFPRASRFKAKARYYLDQSMENPHVTSFSFVLSGGLLVTALALVHLLLHRAFHPHGFEISLSDAYWQMWSYMADPGTHADICPVEIESDPDADDHYCADHEDGAGCRRRAKYYCIALQSWSFFGAFCGIVYFATMLGFLVEGVQSSMARLKLGRNRVVEEDHIVVLGFTDKALALICELALALGLLRTTADCSAADVDRRRPCTCGFAGCGCWPCCCRWHAPVPSPGRSGWSCTRTRAARRGRCSAACPPRPPGARASRT